LSTAKSESTGLYRATKIELIKSLVSRSSRKSLKAIKYIYRTIVQPNIVINYGVKFDIQDPILNPYKKIIYMNAWETDEVLLMRKYIDHNDKVLEIGACIGFISSCASLLIGSRNVTAIEANPNLIDAIKRMNTRNSINFNIINAMISKSSEYAVFHENESIYSSSTSERIGSKSVKNVKCIELQNLPSAKSATFIILDIEGSEYQFFKDFSMPSSTKKLLVEFHGIRKNSGASTNFYPETLMNLKNQSFDLIERRGRVHFFSRK